MQSRKAFTDRLGSFTIRFRVLIPVLFLALVVAAVTFSGRISIVFQATDILNPENPAAQEFAEISDAFGSTAAMVVAIEGPDLTQMQRAGHEMTARIRSDAQMMRYLRSVDGGAPLEYLLDWGLVLLPADQIAELQRILSQDGLVPFLTEVNDALEEQMFAGDFDVQGGNTAEWLGVEVLGRVEAFVTTLTAALAPMDRGEQPSADIGRSLVEALVVGDRFTFTPEKDLLLFYLQPSFPVDDLAATQQITIALEQLASEIEADFPGVEVGLGGGVPQNRVQYDALRYDMTIPTLIALVLIVVLFLLSFERVRNMMLGVLALIVGIVLTVGVLAVTVGQISIVTSVFAVILVGLGVDFGIHLVTNFDDFRARGESPPEAIRHAMRSSGGPIILGGLTTAAVFFAVMTSRSPAIREFGFIGGFGLLLTLASMMILLPTLLINFGTGPRVKPSRVHILRYDFLRRLGQLISRVHVPVIITAVVVTVVLGLAIPTNRVSYDLFAMGPETGPVMDTQRKIIDRMGVSPFVALATADSLSRTASLSEQLRRDPYVSTVASVADLLPPEDEVEERLAAIAAAPGATSGTGPGSPSAGADAPAAESLTEPDVRALADEIQRLEWNVIEAADLSTAMLGPGNRIVRRRDSMIREIVGAEVRAPGREVFQRLITVLEADPAGAADTLSQIDAHFTAALSDQLARMRVDRAPTLDDVPSDLRARFVDPTGSRFLLQIIPTADVQKDDETVLEFDRRMREIDPKITGTLRVYVSLVEEIFTDGWIAALYGAATVFVLMLLIFRSLRRVALAFGVVVVSIVWMFGLLAVFRVPLVMTGALALPLIIGIGMAYVLHILHRYEHERGSIEDTLRYSGKAVFLSSATTGIGFGSLGFFGTIGLASGLGHLLLVGIVCCLLASMVALPAVLATVRPQSRSDRADEGEENT